MVHTLKKILFKILGLKLYLKCMHILFYTAYDLGLLKNKPLFKYHYFIKKLIKKGDYVIDIGANLGYYSKNFSRLVGAEGKVISIEPVKPFFDTLKWGLKNCKNCEVYNYALGTEKKVIELVLPKNGGLFRTGLAHIPSENEAKVDSYVFETQMMLGSELLKDLPKINYIKCDIEGYEEFVFPEIKEIIRKHKPIVQVETNKEIIFEMMKELGYNQYSVYQNKLVKDFSNDIEDGDYLFIHSDVDQKIISELN